MHRVEQLKIWKKSMKVVQDVYQLSAKFPSEEKFGLTSQMRRCAVSIPSNIAEGAGRETKGEFRNFLSIASGSSYELITQLTIAIQLNFGSQIKAEAIKAEVIEIQKMNFSLIKRLKS